MVMFQVDQDDDDDEGVPSLFDKMHHHWLVPGPHVPFVKRSGLEQRATPLRHGPMKFTKAK